LRSWPWPSRTSQAAPRFTTIPIAATAITGTPGICGGAPKRRIASQPSAPENPTRISEFASGEATVAGRELGAGDALGFSGESGALVLSGRGENEAEILLFDLPA
jgi:hypothetical protein